MNARSLQAGFVGTGLVTGGLLPTFLTASVAVEMRDSFPLGDGELSAAIGLSYAAGALASAPAGRLIERIGTRGGIWVGATGSAACMLGIALLADSVGELIVLLAVGGAASAVCVPVGSALITRFVAPGRQGLGLGVQQSGSPVAAVFAGLALPLLAAPFGWRLSFVAAAALTMAIPILAGVLDLAPAERQPRVEIQARPLRRIALAAALGGGATTGMVAFLVIHATDVGLSASSAGLLLAAASLMAACGRVAFGWLADRTGGDELRWMAALIACGAVGFLLLAVAEPATVVIGALIAGGLGWGWTGLMVLAVVGSHPQAPATAVGVVMVGIYVGASGGPLVFGAAAEWLSLAAAWVAGAVMALAAAALAMSARTILVR